MFCPNCGNDCGGANFCPKCGKDLHICGSGAKTNLIPPLEDPYVQEIFGKRIDLHKVIRTYGTGVRKVGAYTYLMHELNITMAQAKEILDPLYTAHAGEKVSFTSGFCSQIGLSTDKKKEDGRRRRELDESGQVYCPKCMSTSISANQKGFGFVRGAIGASAGLDVGMIAGGIGSKKVICTCLKCGYQWKAGKK